MNRCTCLENLPAALTESAVFEKAQETVKGFMHAVNKHIHETIRMGKERLFV